LSRSCCNNAVFVKPPTRTVLQTAEHCQEDSPGDICMFRYERSWQLLLIGRPHRNPAVLEYRPKRIVRDLPFVAIGILEVSRVASPERLLRFFDDVRTLRFQLLTQRIDLGLAA